MSDFAYSPPPSTALQLQRFTLNTIGRDIAVGDIHGCFSKLQVALQAIEFNPIRDRLFSVGDLVDRGPESHKVLEWLDKPWFHAIRGNHEQMVSCSAMGVPLPYIDHMKHGGEWLMQLPQRQRSAIGARLEALPLGFEVETRDGPVGLVHADFPFDDWDDFRNLALNASAIDCCLWSRDRYASKFDQPVANVRAILHGHTTLDSVAKLGNVFYIDTGGWRQGRGHFTLFDLHSLQALSTQQAQRVDKPAAAEV